MVGIVALIGAFTASAQADHGQRAGVTEITRNRVAWSCSRFPKASSNEVKEQTRLQGVQQPATIFAFDGPEAPRTTHFSSPEEGEYTTDAHATWNTNRVRGSFDHFLGGACR